MPQGTQPRSWNGTAGLARRGALNSEIIIIFLLLLTITIRRTAAFEIIRIHAI